MVIDEAYLNDLQAREKGKDNDLLTLIIESQGFPVYLDEEVHLTAILKFRDLFRQTMTLFTVMFIRPSTSANKHIKQKFKREIKKQQQVGE